VTEQERIKESLRKFYDRNVRYHELIRKCESAGLTYDDLLRDIIEMAKSSAGAVCLLDVAVGTGHYMDRARAFGATPFGVDLSIHACRTAKSRNGSLFICRSDAECLPYRSGSFDVALCLQLLEHTPYPENVIAEIARVLKPGGILFLSAPNLLGSNLLTRTYRAARAMFSRDVKRLVALREDILARWDAAGSVQEVSDGDACNRTNIFQAFRLLKRNSFEVRRFDTLRHPGKYRPRELALARTMQKIPLLRFTGINFKIIASKR
jgi:SAM-dependent methyltransferase